MKWSTGHSALAPILCLSVLQTPGNEKFYLFMRTIKEANKIESSPVGLDTFLLLMTFLPTVDQSQDYRYLAV